MGSRSCGPSTGARPNFRASASRRSAWPTERSSPVRPTSPKQASGVPVGVGQRLALVSRDDGEGDCKVRSRLVDSNSARDVYEHVRAGETGSPVPREHRKDHRQAVAVYAVRDPARRHDLRRAQRAPAPRRGAGGCPPSSTGRPNLAPRKPRRRSAPMDPRPPPALRPASRRRRPRWSRQSGS